MVNSQDPFHQYPAKYPKARRKAVEVADHIHSLVKSGPRTMVGTVVDASFHTSQGYVVVTTQIGIVNVYGVPYGSVVNGMRILCRQMGGAATNRAFVFDGAAPNLSGSGYAGSFGYSAMVASLSTGLALTSSTGVPTSAGVSTAQGYFWFFFFYLPALPISKVTLWQMTASAGGNILACEYLPNGYVQVRSQDNHGYLSNTPVSAHNTHWVVIQPFLSGLEFQVDMIANYTGLLSPGDDPTFSGGGVGYQLSLLSNNDGSQLCPLGSWISKFGFGTAWNGVYVPTLQSLGTGLGGVPSLDTELPTATPQQDVTPLYELLCTDTIGSSTLSDSAGAGGTACTISLGGSVNQIGPY